ncbi:MAG: hypothetical protein ACREIU_08610, partial [Planctomycetota bacterium]
MDPLARERLSAAAREFLAAEPWRFLRPGHLVGIRDEESGRLACALLLARGRRRLGLLLGLGPEAFERFSRRWRKIASGTDLAPGSGGFLFGTMSRSGWTTDRPSWQGLGEWRGEVVVACSCIPPDEVRPPSEEEAGFLARALRALARWAGPGSGMSFLAPPPGYPVLTLAGRGGLAIRESFESIAPPRLLPPPLLVRPEVRDSIPSVATADT